MNRTDRVVRIDVNIPVYWSAEQVQAQLHHARHKFVEGLLKEMHNGRYYCVRLEEVWPGAFEFQLAEEMLADRTHWGWFDPVMPTGARPMREFTYKLTALVAPVEERVYHFDKVVDYEAMGWPELCGSAVSEIKKRLARPFRQLAKTLRGWITR